MAPPLSDTRNRLLDAAGETFAEQGFQNSTVREICRRAGANIAAVNYHFGGKEELYAAVLTQTAQMALEQYPIGGGVDPGSPACERLRAFIRAYLERLLDEGRPAWFGKLVAREMFEPTAALDKVAQVFAKPQYERLRTIVGELLGARAEPDLIRQTACSILGQCLFYKHARPMIERLALTTAGVRDRWLRPRVPSASGLSTAAARLASEAWVLPLLLTVAVVVGNGFVSAITPISRRGDFGQWQMTSRY